MRTINWRYRVSHFCRYYLPFLTIMLGVSAFVGYLQSSAAVGFAVLGGMLGYAVLVIAYVELKQRQVTRESERAREQLKLELPAIQARREYVQRYYGEHLPTKR